MPGGGEAASGTAASLSPGGEEGCESVRSQQAKLLSDASTHCTVADATATAPVHPQRRPPQIPLGPVSSPTLAVYFPSTETGPLLPLSPSPSLRPSARACVWLPPSVSVRP